MEEIKGTQRILVVEDMPKNLQMIGSILRKEGYLVSMAINVEDAYKSIEHEIPDLILSDIMMPGTNGFDFCKQLKANSSLKNIPVIFLSGLADKLNKIHGFSIGASDYITKPVEKDEMLARIETHLRIRKLTKDLELSNSVLERKVKERTYELELAKEKAEESDRVKSAFLASISHELRTPLNSIIGFSDLVINNIKSEKVLSFVKSINKSGHQLLEIIEGIFSIALLETGETIVKKKIFSLSNFVDEIEQLVNEELSLKLSPGVDLIHTKPELPERITLNTDHFKLKQIILVLIKNAIKFTNSGTIEYGVTIENEKIKFFVHDSGIGIPEEYHDVIFEKFTQIETGDNKSYGGLGIGLSIAKQLSELLGFKIDFTSNENSGSHFSIEINEYLIEDCLSGEIASPKDEQKVFQNKKILIAEDELTNYKLLKITLEHYGAMIILAHNGKQAIEKVKTENPDLILMDLRMPVMNGFDAIKMIRKFNNDIPIITQTAYSVPEVFHKDYMKLIDKHLQKPIDRKHLIEIIAQYLTPRQ